jgi:hypothetical protein
MLLTSPHGFVQHTRRVVFFPACNSIVHGFAVRVRPLVDDRNENRAHRYERGTSTAASLGIEQTRDLFTYVRSVLNDICLVALSSKWAENDLNFAHSGATAEELVDMIVLPRWVRDEMITQGIERTAAYDQLHMDGREGVFNSREKLFSLVNQTDE